MPPAFESMTSSDIIRENLNAMHEARKNYIKAESSERIKRGLRHNVRTYSEVQYENGDKVFYRREKLQGWRGPAMVFGQEGKVVLIRHGSSYHRCHPCNLMKVHRTFGTANVCSSTKTHQKNQGHLCKKREEVIAESSDSDSDVEIQSEEEHSDHGSDKDDVEEDSEEEQSDVESRVDSEDHFDDDHISNDSDDDSEEEQQGDQLNEGDIEDSSEVEQDNDEYQFATRDCSVNETDGDQCTSESRPKLNTTVKCKLNNGDQLIAKVLSVQPKRSGKHGHWVNIQEIGKEEPGSINWREVAWWKEIEESENVVLLSAAQELQQDVLEAKEEEINNLKENDVFVWVEDHGEKVISTKLIISEKRMSDGKKKLKARPVCRGFEEKNDDVRTDSPTCSRKSPRMVFVTAATMSWELQSSDITAAFLQGNVISRDVYVRPPAEVKEPGLIWKLRRYLYGLNDAPRAWYDRVDQELKKLSAVRSAYDDAMFIWHNKDGTLMGILVSHVDDFVFGGCEKWHQDVIQSLLSTFKISRHSYGSFMYTGLNVVQTTNSILIDHHDYIASRKPIQLSNERAAQKDDPLTFVEKARLRSFGGQLLWVTTQTRPD